MRFRGAAYAVAVVWLNAYVCRWWFFHPTAHMATLYGYWTALARSGAWSWHPQWWRYWDLGIPFEFTSPPLVPAMAAAFGGGLLSVQAVSAVFYCAAPLALFLAAWMLTRSPDASFVAAIAYSLFSPAQFIVPEGPFGWSRLLEPHRFMLQAVWDETPRCAALTFLLLFLALLERRAFAGAAVALALAMLATPYIAISAALAVLCLIVARPSEWKREAGLAAVTFVFALALGARWLPPSLWGATVATLTLPAAIWLAGLAVVWLIVLGGIEKCAPDWQVRFFLLWSVTLLGVVTLTRWWPHAHRFRLELEAAIALAAVFSLRPFVRRFRIPLALAGVAVATAQTVHHRRLAKDALFPADLTRTVEYRVARRLGPDRVLLPGSIARWANAFAPVTQFGGGEGSIPYSDTHRRALIAAFSKDAPESLAYLEAYGAGVVVVSGPGSREVFHPFDQPRKFDGLLPVLWSEEGVTAYEIPRHSPSLAHVIPVSALGDPTRYNAALDDPTVPAASLEWIDRNRLRVRADVAPGHVVSIQESYHPGWHGPLGVRGDALGLMWIEPDHPGPLDVELVYDGGRELRICSWVTIGAAVCLLCLARRR
jgi:hypothetical protein